MPRAPPATAYFAGGCFWGVEGVFSHVKGVKNVVSGYGGGPAKLTVDYEAVGTGRTGYAESVRVIYDPTQVSYGTLLRIFFSVITDPTTLNYQGPDHGTQYRSALFPQSAEQEKVATAYLAQLGKSGFWRDPIVTKIEAVGRFQPAEDYHQDFMKLNPTQGYIRMWGMRPSSRPSRSCSPRTTRQPGRPERDFRAACLSLRLNPCRTRRPAVPPSRRPIARHP